MNYSLYLCFILWITIPKLCFTLSNDNHTRQNFLQCLSHQFRNSSSSNDDLIYTQNEPSYITILTSSIKNQRFAFPSFTKPVAIVTPTKASHVQATVYCSKKHGVEIRTRSGGHDFEGLSYVAVDKNASFVVIDLIKLRSISVDVYSQTAWVQAGATIGELYYRIAEKSNDLGFPAGLCHTVGVGGHLSGGGYGMMMRKYGLAADNIIDAELVDVKGRVLNRRSMGEDLFWAIRGGGGASFGIILSWKVRLVRVPSNVTILSVVKNLEQNGTMKLVDRWQNVAHRFDGNLTLLVRFQTVNTSAPTLQVSFLGLFLGRVEMLIPMVREIFPELGLTREDCTEMNWINSVLYFAGFPIGQSPEALLSRNPQIPQVELPFKGKSDYVTEPIPEKALEIVVRKLYDIEAGFYQFFPYGAKMSEIPDHQIPFPHRRGNLYQIFYIVFWGREENEEQSLRWLRSVYNYMAPYVSKNPRSAYFNYRDLDIGNGSTSYAQASIWGTKYFKGNFRRLARVKNTADPTNFFRNEQSIPPLRMQ